MAGVYLHIPFCKRACHYCNFHFSTSLKGKNDFIDALLREMALRRNYIQGEPVQTVYFGGGTPSLLTGDELKRIMDHLHMNFAIAGDAEITLEANPDDISATAIAAWKSCGINRTSIGVQSFFDEDLRWMNRAHTAGQAADCIKRCQDAGISNMNIDLIYGTPSLPDENWNKNLSTAVELGVPHLSCYALTVEPGTALEVLTKRKKMASVNSDDQARQFLLMTDFLQLTGYEHYEISNFALPGKRSRHNSAYWKGENYIGLGPSAHSFNGVSRQWNVANNALYVQAGGDSAETEQLTINQQFNEYLMTSIRTAEGTDLEFIKSRFGDSFFAGVTGGARKFVQDGKLIIDDQRMFLTTAGKLFADGIASELFVV
jgi:oxygen-independent coproporphyrinogen-3 oxidase